MEAEKTSEEIIKVGNGEKNPHAVKAFIISLFAVVFLLKFCNVIAAFPTSCLSSLYSF